MIKSFGNKLAEDLYYDRKSRLAKKFSPDLHRVVRRKLLYLHEADQLDDLKTPPGNRLKALKGDLREYYSIRVNEKWRIVFKWSRGASDVQVVDYHK